MHNRANEPENIGAFSERISNNRKITPTPSLAFASLMLHASPHMTRLRLRFVLPGILAILFACVPGSTAWALNQNGDGIAWDVKGIWHTVPVHSGESGSQALRDGDAVSPRTLLQPDPRPGQHSVTVLLPDGQRILYECFAAPDCERGFRVPPLNSRPSAFALDLLSRISGSTIQDRDESISTRPKDRMAARDEEVVRIGPRGLVEISGLAASLSEGAYTCDLQELGGRYPPKIRVPLRRSGRHFYITLPAPGLYRLTISDRLHTPRIDLMLGALKPGDAEKVKAFGRARELLEDWAEAYQGWPVDDLLRAYLKSLM